MPLRHLEIDLCISLWQFCPGITLVPKDLLMELKAKAIVRARKPLRLTGRNSMTFPQELRAAIPEARGYSGRVLELDAIDGKVREVALGGPVVHLDLRVQETGNLTGKFTLWMDLQPSAARAFAATLSQMADRAERAAGS
jgi:hypothetical protein